MVSPPVTNPPEDRPPLALATEWVARITTISLEMVLPGLAGQWLDERWGTGFLGLTGFGLGLAIGIWHLLLMTGSVGKRRTPDDGSKPGEMPDDKEIPR